MLFNIICIVVIIYLISIIKKEKKSRRIYINCFYDKPKTLTFYYGTMKAGKTLHAIVKAYNYKKQNKGVIVLKPGIDTRFNKSYITSRCGLSRRADW